MSPKNLENFLKLICESIKRADLVKEVEGTMNRLFENVESDMKNFGITSDICLDRAEFYNRNLAEKEGFHAFVHYVTCFIKYFFKVFLQHFSHNFQKTFFNLSFLRKKTFSLMIMCLFLRFGRK